MAPMNVAIAGFSGKMARMITKYLLERHTEVVIHGLARSPEKVDPTLRNATNVKMFQASSNDISAIREAIRGTNVVICCYLGDDELMINGQKLLVDACIAEGVPRYLASDYSFDFRGLKPGEHPAKEWILDFSAYLEEKEKAGKIKGVHILNGCFMEVFWAPFLGYANAAEGTFKYYGTGDEPLELTTMDDTAQYTAEVAADPNATGWFKFLGDRKSLKQVAGLYGEAYGIKPELQRQGSLDDLVRVKDAAYKADPNDSFAYMGLSYQLKMADGTTYLGNLDDHRYPVVRPTDVSLFLQRYTKDTIGNSYMTQ